MTFPRALVSVVDDDESVRESLPDLLRQLGFAAEAFASAEAFLQSGLVHQTRCLILDVAMPGMSGLELQRELAQQRHAVPIVFITAQHDRNLRPRVMAGGAIECLLKPFSETALLEAVNRAVDTTPSAPSDAVPIVFVVDDDVSVREAVAGMLQCAGWCSEAFSSAEAFLERPRVSVPSCLVLDVRLPDLDGLDLQTRLSCRPDMPIIFISGNGDVPMTVRAMKAGAVEFLTKPFSDDTLLGAIGDAIARSRTILAHEAHIAHLRACHASLSPRERQVMALVVSGLLNKQVAGELGISEITVKAHRGQVMRKMKAASFADLVTMSTTLAASAR